MAARRVVFFSQPAALNVAGDPGWREAEPHRSRRQAPAGVLASTLWPRGTDRVQGRVQTRSLIGAAPSRAINCKIGGERKPGCNRQRISNRAFVFGQG